MIDVHNKLLVHLSVGGIINISLLILCWFVFPDEQQRCSGLCWKKHWCEPSDQWNCQVPGEHFCVPKKTAHLVSSCILGHSFPVYTTDSCSGCCTIIREQTLNSAPIAFCCAFLMCLPSSLDYDVFESKDYFSLLFAYPASETLLEIWLASLKVLWFN